MPVIRKPRMVNDWRRAWRWWSVRIPFAVAAATGYWMGLEETRQRELLSLLNLDHPGWLVIAGCAAAILGRLAAQGQK